MTLTIFLFLLKGKYYDYESFLEFEMVLNQAKFWHNLFIV